VKALLSSKLRLAALLLLLLVPAGWKLLLIKSAAGVPPVQQRPPAVPLIVLRGILSPIAIEKRRWHKMAMPELQSKGSTQHSPEARSRACKLVKPVACIVQHLICLLMGSQSKPRS
jgi:hypothetical protein